MNIEEYFEQFNGVDIIFDPIPTYEGNWRFGMDILKDNALIDSSNQNMLEEFINKTYFDILKQLFKSASKTIKDFSIGFVATNRIDRSNGRCLKYSKSCFFKSLLSFFTQNLDKLNRSEDEHIQYLINLYNNIQKDNDSLIFAYSNEVKLKLAKIKDLKERELNSDYYDAAFADYENYTLANNLEMSFREYLDNMERVYQDLFVGIMSLSDFFERELDYKELSKCFDLDVFYLLFADIIYDYNELWLNKHETLASNFPYLVFYKNFLENIRKENENYNPKINKKGNEYTSIELLKNIEDLFQKHEDEIKEVVIPSKNEEAYKNVDFVDQLKKLYNNSNFKENWTILPTDSKIEKCEVNEEAKENVENLYADTELIKEFNMQIDILLSTGYVGSIIKGKNGYNGYYAFIYENGNVIIEKLDKNDISKYEKDYTYIIDIETFISLISQQELFLNDFIKTNNNCKRIFHDGINEWQKQIYEAIYPELAYDPRLAVSYVDKIQRKALEEDERNIQ